MPRRIDQYPLADTDDDADFVLVLQSTGTGRFNLRRQDRASFRNSLGNSQYSGFGAVLDGGGAVISEGPAGDMPVPFACEIIEVSALADQSGSIIVDVWRDTFANFPPTVGGSITGAYPVKITSSEKSTDATLTGWSKTLAAGDVLRFNVNSVATIQRVTIFFKVRRT